MLSWKLLGLIYAFLKAFRTYRCFLKFMHVRLIVVVLVKRFDIYIEFMLYMFRFIIFDYIF